MHIPRYLTVAKKVDLKISHHKKEMITLNRMEMLANTVMATMLQFTNASNQNIAHIKLTEIISVKLGKIPQNLSLYQIPLDTV